MYTSRIIVVVLIITDGIAVGVARQCSNVPGWLTRLKRGVDITSLDLLPTNMVGKNGFLKPVIDFTCTEGKTITLSNRQYDLPDQLWDITSVPRGWANADVSIYKNSRDVTRRMSSNVGVNFLEGFFSASGSYENSQHTVTNTSRYIEAVSAFVSGQRADLAPYWVLSLGQYAQMFVNNMLPANMSNNNDLRQYMEFIRTFGTHYFAHGTFGGLIQHRLETESSYYFAKTDRQVEAQAKASFFKWIQANGGRSTGSTTVDASFTAATSSSARYYGGDTNLLSSTGIQAWQPTVAADPWLFGGELANISQLVDDNNKRQNLERAIQIYLDLAYLRELERILISANQKFTFGAAALQAYLTEARQAIATGQPDHTAVTRLSDQVTTDVSIPAWFKENTQLCYRWHPDGNGGQCGGGAGRHLCARPGQMTPYYRDDSDRRPGGCQMSWGIESTGYPEWFAAVQVCFRWYPDGDGGQCGGGASRNLCAPIGQYTSYYRDDSDRRGGGCQMSWKLDVPTSGPLWMKNIKLCYYWYPDGDGGQCGGGAGRHLCARANGWTAYYRDDTDRRGGGCQMSWGLQFTS